MKMTAWFSGNVKPVHIGVYQKVLHDLLMYQMWDGVEWKGCALSAERASMQEMRSEFQKTDWRGLAEKPE